MPSWIPRSWSPPFGAITPATTPAYRSSRKRTGRLERAAFRSEFDRGQAVNAFLDTSVMVAAFWGDHPSHDASLQIFAEANRQTGACCIHSLAEVYATMTALPVRPALAPEQVFLFVQQISERLTAVA